MLVFAECTYRIAWVAARTVATFCFVFQLPIHTIVCAHSSLQQLLLLFLYHYIVAKILTVKEECIGQPVSSLRRPLMGPNALKPIYEDGKYINE